MDDLFGDDFSGNAPTIPSNSQDQSQPDLSSQSLDFLSVPDQSSPSSMTIEENKNDLVGEITDNDPAMEFIEKEKQELGGLGFDLGLENNDTTTIEENMVQDFTSAGADLTFDSIQDEPDSSMGITSTTLDPGLDTVSYDGVVNDMDVPRTGDADPLNDQSSFNLPTSRKEVNDGVEPDCIVQWRKKQAERIAIKDKEEEEKMKEMREKAKKDLDEWNRKYQEEVNTRKEENKYLEEKFLEEVHGLKPGTEWERVAKNCGFNSKVVHCKKDRSRLRNVILSLKQTPLLNRN